MLDSLLFLLYGELVKNIIHLNFYIMRLVTITCSGANEHTEIETLVSTLQPFKNAELGIQVSNLKGAYATARYWWLRALYLYLIQNRISIPIALHINSGWVEDFCQGRVAPELEKFLCLFGADERPFIKRVQLNFKIGREKTPNLEVLRETICRFPNQRFILSCNESNAGFIQELYQTGLEFDLLYDNSFGEGILPDVYPAPRFKYVLHGYAGGLSPDNVIEELNKISKVIPCGAGFCIDAEGKLKGDDRHFSLKKCRRFLEVASKWDEF